MKTEQKIIDFAASGSNGLRDAKSAEAAANFKNDPTRQAIVENIFQAGWNNAMAAVIDFINADKPE